MKPVMLAAMACGAALLFSGCVLRTNLAARRGAYDAYLDLPGRAEADYQEKLSYYHEILAAASNPHASPYPELGADFEAMKRHIADMQLRRQRIQEFEKKFDSFAQGRVAVSSDQPAEWGQYQGLDSEFRPLGQSMQVALQGYNQAAADFQRSLDTFHVGRVKVSDLENEINAFRDEMGRSVNEAADRLREDHRAVKAAEAAHLDPELFRRKAEILGRMERAMEGLEAQRRQAVFTADKQYGELPEADTMWCGPGMEDDGSDLAALRQSEAGFRGRAMEIFELSERFRSVRPAGAR